MTRTPDDLSISHARDPFVFHFAGHRYAIQGAGHVHGRPRILGYGCDSLRSWTGPWTVLDGDDPVAARIAPANIWECPNLVRIGRRWVLIVSLWRQTDAAVSLSGVRYLVGKLTAGPAGPRFIPSGGGRLDEGPCFYAPQVLTVGGSRAARGVVLGARPIPGRHHRRRLGWSAHVLPGAVATRRRRRVPACAGARRAAAGRAGTVADPG